MNGSQDSHGTQTSHRAFPRCQAFRHLLSVMHTLPNILSGYLHDLKRLQHSPHLKLPLVQVLAREGDQVEEGDSLVVLEAMKMEHTVRAPCGGVVTGLAAVEGAQVSDGVTLAFIDAGQPASASAA